MATPPNVGPVQTPKTPVPVSNVNNVAPAAKTTEASQTTSVKQPSDSFQERTALKSEYSEKDLSTNVGPTALHEAAHQQSAPSEDGSYTVKRGDTLWGILAKQGFSPAEIKGKVLQEAAQMNGLDNPNQLKVGQKLTLPNKEGAKPETKTADNQANQTQSKQAQENQSKQDTQVVKQGDTITKLLLDRGWTKEQIKDLDLVGQVARESNLKDPNKLKPGDKLIMPGSPVQVNANDSQDGNSKQAQSKQGPSTSKNSNAAQNGGGQDTQVVKPGDTITKLLMDRGWTKEQIKDLDLVGQVARESNLKDPNKIKPGDKLVMPGSPVQVNADDSPTTENSQNKVGPTGDGQVESRAQTQSPKAKSNSQSRSQSNIPKTREKEERRTTSSRTSSVPRKKVADSPETKERKNAYYNVWNDMKGANDRKHFSISTRKDRDGNVMVTVKNKNPNDPRNGNVDYYRVDKNGKKKLVGSDTKEGCKTYE